jgi:hypothetical protein
LRDSVAQRGLVVVGEQARERLLDEVVGRGLALALAALTGEQHAGA